MSVINVSRPNTDRLLNEQITSSLRELGYPQMTQIECKSSNGVVTLCGTLASFYFKQIAQTIAWKVPGVNHVVNRIQVVR